MSHFLAPSAQATDLFVTKTYMPPLEQYQRYLEGIWQRAWVTNNGPLAQQLEARLQDHLGVPFVQYVTNGTVALQLAIRALGLEGKVITTPYSYVATLNAILWENCEPVFVDIAPNTLCINADLIEAQIDEDTSAILATHVYGYPCDVEKIATLAKKYDLKVIYDGAHAFGVEVGGQSIFRYGDLSTVSFHATKLFHTIEGGGVMTNNSALSEKIFLYKAFGHRADDYQYASINGKNSEFHAAIGLCNLPTIDQVIDQRRTIFQRYQDLLYGTSVRILQPRDSIRYNYAYFPVILSSHESMLRVKAALEADRIFPRRYFYPSLNQLPYHQGATCPVSEDITERVLCLPFYHELASEDVERVALIVKNNA